MNEISGCVAYRRKKIDKPYRKKAAISVFTESEKGKQKGKGGKDIGSK